MQIIYKTKNFVIGNNAALGDTFLSRAKGLMFSKPKDMILVSPKESIKHSSIHMFFMLYPIDVIWLDRRLRVVDIKKGLPPLRLFKISTWRVYKPKKPAKYVIELGVGKTKETDIGDEIVFES